MNGPTYFHKEIALFAPYQAHRPGLAARLRPHELIAMLTHHYTRARARSLPRVKTTLCVTMPGGRQAVVIGFGR